jgi:hypothetical protein
MGTPTLILGRGAQTAYVHTAREPEAESGMSAVVEAMRILMQGELSIMMIKVAALLILILVRPLRTPVY